MNRVFIAGIGQTKVGELWEKSLRNLSAEAVIHALNDAKKPKVDALYVGNFLASAISNQANLGVVVATNVGLVGVETFTVEAGEASGAAAIRMAYLAVRSGYVRTALVVGVEKFTDIVGNEASKVMAYSMDYDFEVMQGLTPAGQAGMLMARYLNNYQPPRDELGALSIQAHANAVKNPNAMYKREITVEAYRNASVTNDPMNIFDEAPMADGAAAVLLTSDLDIIQSVEKSVVEIIASTSAIDRLALHDRADSLIFNAVINSTQKAFNQANMTWEDIDLYELWDIYSIYSILSVEATGLAPKGEGWRWLAESDHSPKSDLPIVTMGGNKARGFPLGAAGVYQVVEAVLQLREEAGKNQVIGAKTALVQAMGGPASNVITHILSKV